MGNLWVPITPDPWRTPAETTAAVDDARATLRAMLTERYELTGAGQFARLFPAEGET